MKYWAMQTGGLASNPAHFLPTSSLDPRMRHSRVEFFLLHRKVAHRGSHGNQSKNKIHKIYEQILIYLRTYIIIRKAVSIIWCAHFCSIRVSLELIAWITFIVIKSLQAANYPVMCSGMSCRWQWGVHLLISHIFFVPLYIVMLSLHFHTRVKLFQLLRCICGSLQLLMKFAHVWTCCCFRKGSYDVLRVWLFQTQTATIIALAHVIWIGKPAFKLEQLDLFMSVHPHLATSYCGWRVVYAFEQLQVFIFNFFDIFACIADLATN